jgi:hypothetical protein
MKNKISWLGDENEKEIIWMGWHENEKITSWWGWHKNEKNNFMLVVAKK